ncbi:MAG: flap endonuclease-1 [Pyrobaculum sp.]
MGVVELGKLIGKDVRRELKLENLAGRCVVLDIYNALYQFLSSIRQPDGTPLMDRAGRVTSHLSGLFYRTINLLEAGIRPVYVFDGRPPEFKLLEIERRKKTKEKAVEDAIAALKEGKREEAVKYIKRAVFLTSEMIEEAKRLLTYVGVPWIQAPSEGEAQAAYMARRGHCWAVGSQDYDSLLFGAPRLVRNLATAPKRKVGEEVIELSPELIELDAVLKSLRLKNREQLIDLAILLGTDYNPDGVAGIGPQKALKLVWEFGNIEKILATVLRDAYFPVDPREIKNFFLNPPVVDNYNIEIGKPDEKSLHDFLVEEHDFGEERVKKALERLRRALGKAKTSSLDQFF